MELSAPGAKDLGRGGGHGTWPTLGLPRAHSIQSQITTLILHHEMVQVNHLVLTAVLCITAAICSTHRELKRLVQRHTAVNAEHAFLCEQVYFFHSHCQNAWHLPRGALRMGGDQPLNRYRLRHMPWGPGPWMGLVPQPQLTWVPATPPSSPLCLPLSVPSGWTERKSGSLLSQAKGSVVRV